MSPAFISSATDIFVSPTHVFDRIREKTLSAWFPFILLLALATLVYGWYFMTVDMYQFMETSIQLSGKEVNPAEMEMVLSQESVIRVVSVVQTTVFGAVVFLIMALFFFLAAAVVAEEKLKFGQFFAMVAWGSMPQLLSFLSIAVSIALASDFIFFSFLDKTSLASILGLSLDAANYQLFSSITVGSVWAFALYGIGFYRLTRCSAVTATIVALIPVAIQYGLMSLL